MKAKLIKDHQEYMLINNERFVIATTDVSILNTTDKMKLSKQNCDELFGVVDVEKLAEKEYPNPIDEEGEPHWDSSKLHHRKKGFIEGFNKAVELNKDKVFTLEDMKQALITMQVSHNVIRTTEDREELIQSFLNPTEIDVTFNPDEKDSEGNLILKNKTL
jgi:hypothetical protein